MQTTTDGQHVQRVERVLTGGIEGLGLFGAEGVDLLALWLRRLDAVRHVLGH